LKISFSFFLSFFSQYNVHHINFAENRGTIAEFISVPTSALALKSTSVSFVQAAALPCVALTAIQALRTAKLEPGANVLVIGASGGCGTIGVQMAKALGAANVTAICSSKNETWVRSLGADNVHMYDTSSDPLPLIESSRVRELGFDVILDTVR
jgi:NADPH:quinone reductase-like Zn-dependent oxidoreductase